MRIGVDRLQQRYAADSSPEGFKTRVFGAAKRVGTCSSTATEMTASKAPSKGKPSHAEHVGVVVDDLVIHDMGNQSQRPARNRTTRQRVVDDAARDSS